MATQTVPLTDAAYTSEQAVLTDTIANEVYAAHYYRDLLGSFSTILLVFRAFSR